MDGVESSVNRTPVDLCAFLHVAVTIESYVEAN